MRRVRSTAGTFWIALLAAVTAASCSQVSATPAIDREVLIAREAAWRAYFAGDVKTLGDLLPAEFIGIGMNDGPFTDRTGTLDGARAFHEGGDDSSDSRSLKRSSSGLAMSWCSMAATKP